MAGAGLAHLRSLIASVPIGPDDQRDAEWTTALRVVSTGLCGPAALPGIGHARLRPDEMLTIGRCQRHRAAGLPFWHTSGHH